MTRVLTDKGFGEVSPIDFNLELDAKIKVELEEMAELEGKGKFSRRQTFQRRNVYEFGDHIIVRLANVNGIGIHSGLVSFKQPVSAYRAYNTTLPEGETRFLLSLASGQFEASDRLGLLENRFLHLQPWMDRWEPELGALSSSDDDSLDAAISKFDEWQKKCAGTSGGIRVHVILSMGETRILRFAVVGKSGIICSKHF